MKFFKLKFIILSIRLGYLKLKFFNNIKLVSVRVGIEKDFLIIVKNNNSKILFGRNNYFQRFGNLEVYDGGKIEFGNNISINKGCSIVCRSNIKFGNDIMVGPNVMIYDHDHNHYLDHNSFNKQGFKSSPIILGNNIWIGSNVFISSGVSIGSNVVIAAGSIVINNVESNTIIGGNPARVLKKLT